MGGRRNVGAIASEFPAEDLRSVWSSVLIEGIENFWSGLPVSMEPDGLQPEPYIVEDADRG